MNQRYVLNLVFLQYFFKKVTFDIFLFCLFQPSLVPQFKARVPTVLHRKPFEPVKPNRQLPLPDVTLASEIRAKDREVYDRQLMQREQEMEAARQLVSTFSFSQIVDLAGSFASAQKLCVCDLF